MTDFTVRSDGVDVEEIMRQIRLRIREKRGVDYTEDEIRELASVKLERFLDPGKVRSGLLEEFRRRRQDEAAFETFDFEDKTIYASHRLPFLQTIRRILNPALKLFFNPNPIIRALHVQAKLNHRYVEKEQLDYEIMSNLVLEITKLSLEVKHLKMRLESLSARLDFDEHRARALEGVVQYRPGALSSLGLGEAETEAASEDEAAEAESTAPSTRRRRRRRGRRRAGLSMPAEQRPASAGPSSAGDALSTDGAPDDEEARGATAEPLPPERDVEPRDAGEGGPAAPGAQRTPESSDQ